MSIKQVIKARISFALAVVLESLEFFYCRKAGEGKAVELFRRLTFLSEKRSLEGDDAVFYLL